MGHEGFDDGQSHGAERARQQHRGGKGGPGPWAAFGNAWQGGGVGRSGRAGPPPWVAGLLGLDDGGEQRRGPRARRGDVRSAILDVLRTTGEPVNGYQVIQQMSERSGGAWKPSPGSVYPTVQQLQDEGLVEAEDDRGRRTLRLSAEGTSYAAEHLDELEAVWAPFEQHHRDERGSLAGDLRPEIGQVMGAVWQVVTSGSDQQRRAAVDVLVEARRKLYGILADGDQPDAEEATS